MTEKNNWIWIGLGLIGSLMLFVGGISFAVAFFLPGWIPDQGSLFGFLVLGIGLLGIFLGGMLVIAGIRGFKNLPPWPVYSKRVWIFFLLGIISAGVVAALIPGDLHETPGFASIHLVLIVFPALMLFYLASLVAGQEHAITFTQLALVVNGGALSTLLALPLEVIGFAFSALFIALFIFILPGGRDEIAQLVEQFESLAVNPVAMSSIDGLGDLISSPVVWGTLALTLGVVTPVVEELGKTLLLGLIGFWQRPSLTRSFLWGAACGLGFAMVEGFTNGSMGLGDVASWAGGVGSRILASSMHIFTSGIVGLGWGFFWQKKRWALPLAYLVAIVFHGLWNFNIVLMVGGGALTAGGAMTLGAGIALVALLVQGFLMLFAPIALIGMPLLIREFERGNPAAV
ncbi:MAG: PrsW family intramembrane metalloprotease [Anaerolineae bacterium]|nr:PrsW family intramembrane metalloprotease [Anaerolineae bacterium]